MFCEAWSSLAVNVTRGVARIFKEGFVSKKIVKTVQSAADFCWLRPLLMSTLLDRADSLSRLLESHLVIIESHLIIFELVVAATA